MKNEKNSPIFAFWKYDLYPYVLSGLVAKVEPARVHVHGYGWIRPLFLLPADEGGKLHVRLQQLRVDYEQAQRECKDRAVDELRSALGPLAGLLS